MARMGTGQLLVGTGGSRTGKLVPCNTLVGTHHAMVIFHASQLLTKDYVVIVLGIHWCHTTKEAEPLPLFNKRRNWTATGTLPNSSVSYMSGVWYPDNFTECPHVKLASGAALEQH